MLPDDRQTTSNTQNTQRNFNQPDNRNTTLTSTAGVSPRAEADANALISYNHLTYFLYVVSYFTAGLLWIVPIVMNYLKRGEAQGTWLATHFDWQIKTFWYSIVFFLIGSAIVIFSLGGLGVSIFTESGHVAAGSFGLLALGFGILGITVLWHLYRIVRGWIALVDKRPVP